MLSQLSYGWSLAYPGPTDAQIAARCARIAAQREVTFAARRAEAAISARREAFFAQALYAEECGDFAAAAQLLELATR